MKKLLVIVLGLIAAIVVLPLTYNNTDKVTLNYLTFSYETHLSWLLIGAFLLGTILSLLFFAITGLGWKIKAKGLSKKVDELIKQRQREEIAEQFESEKKTNKTSEKAA